MLSTEEIRNAVRFEVAATKHGYVWQCSELGVSGPFGHERFESAAIRALMWAERNAPRLSIVVPDETASRLVTGN